MKWQNTLRFNFWPKGIKQILRVIIASARGFSEDNCSLKASALTFYSLLSIIPGLAVAFGIAKGFGFEGPLEKELLETFSEQKEITEKLITFAYNTLENAKGGVIAGVGLIVLFWSVIKLLASIESSFNSIWKLPHSRSLSRQLSDYLAMILFCPLFFAAASSLIVFVATQLTQISEVHDKWGFNPIVITLIRVFPFVIAWMLFTALYYVMPNTRVPFKNAFIAGLIAGTIYQFAQWIYIHFQISLASYGAIYGSFAALPLFLIWLNTSWLVALAGAEVAYHSENIATHTPTPEGSQHQIDARIVGLLIMQQSMHYFQKGSTPPTINEISQHIDIGLKPLKYIIQKLIAAGLLVEVHWANDETPRYQPGKLAKYITIQLVCDALNDSKHDIYLTPHTPLIEEYEHALATMDEIIKEHPINTTLDDAH